MAAILTKRERRLYTGVCALTSITWFGGLVGYFLLSDRAHHATLLEICFFAVNTIVMFAFGYALRTDLRVVRGIPWLQEQSAVSERQGSHAKDV